MLIKKEATSANFIGVKIGVITSIASILPLGRYFNKGCATRLYRSLAK